MAKLTTAQQAVAELRKLGVEVKSWKRSLGVSTTVNGERKDAVIDGRVYKVEEAPALSTTLTSAVNRELGIVWRQSQSSGEGRAATPQNVEDLEEAEI